MTTQPPEPALTITLKDVYLKLCYVQDQVAAMTPQAQQITDHEGRLRTLERWKYTLPTSMLLALVSIVVAVIEAKP